MAALVLAGGAGPALAQLPAMRDRPLSAAERSRLQGLEAEIVRISAQRNTSAAAVRAVARKLGARLTTTDPAELVRLIDRSAQNLSAARGRIAELEQELESLDSMRLARAVAPLLEAANAAIESGELDLAEAKLAEAGEQFATARQGLEGRLAELSAREADITAQRAAVRLAGFDNLAAAELYGKAAALTPESDANRRWGYLFAQAKALGEQGQDGSNKAALEQASAILADQALPLVDRATRPDDWLATQVELGRILRLRGQYHNDGDALKAGVEALKLAAEATPRGDGDLWLQRQIAHAVAVGEQQRFDGDFAHREEALRLSEAAFAQASTTDFRTLGNRAVLMFFVGSWNDDAALLRRSVELTEAAGARLDPARSPRDWLRNRINLGAGRTVLAEVADSDADFAAAVADLRMAVERADAEQFPTLNAQAKSALAGTLSVVAQRPGYPDRVQAVDDAIAILEAVAAATSREQSEANWQAAMASLGRAHFVAAEITSDDARIARAIEVFETVGTSMTAESNPGDLMLVERNIGQLWMMRARARTGEERAAALVEAERALLAARPLAVAQNDDRNLPVIDALLAEIESLRR